MNISLAILFATEGFVPKDVRGRAIETYENFNSALPLLTFILSLFSASFGMSKFFLSGPIQFLPSKSVVKGLMSIPFLSLFLINSMFGFRIISIESAFFTSYRFQSDNSETRLPDITEILPIISPEYRILIYLAPCIIPALINVLRLWCTTKGLWKYFIKYPQFLISPCFTPFLYEGYETTNQHDQYKLKIWKLGSVINAIYIGCIPQCILCITDYYRGIHDRDQNFITEIILGDVNTQINRYEGNDALIKSNHGNTIFATITALFFLILITVFFGNEKLFKGSGIRFNCFNILCCSCLKPCINVNEPELDPPSSLTASSQATTTENVEDLESRVRSAIDLKTNRTEILLNNHRGETKVKQLGKSPRKDINSKAQVINFLIFVLLRVSYEEKYFCIIDNLYWSLGRNR